MELSSLHLETGKYWTGGTVQVLNLHRALTERGVRSLLIAPRGSEIAARAQQAGLPVEELPFRGEGDLLAIWRLRRIIKKFRPTILELHSRRGAPLLGELAALTIARHSRPKVIVHRRVDNRPSSDHLQRWQLTKGCDFVIAISRRIYNVLIEYGVSREKLELVYSSVDLEGFAEPYSREEFARLLDLPAEAQVVGIVAQLIERKGHSDLLKAFARVAAEYPSLYVVVCGRGPLEESLRTEAQTLGIADRVRFAGFRQDLRRLLPSFTMLAHPAYMEGLGVAVLEAMAAGVPVIACNAGGLPEMVLDRQTGLLVEPGDVAGLETAIRRLLESPAQAARYAEAARIKVLEDFSLETMVDRTLAIYKRLLQPESGKETFDSDGA